MNLKKSKEKDKKKSENFFKKSLLINHVLIEHILIENIFIVKTFQTHYAMQVIAIADTIITAK